ncbi:MAG TPA: hypothetical protein VNI20_08565 [Fimbriimonadaceae bacterium]|nr:hypothetical protein [Fimbriimonadaceae bacterium]
MADEPTQRDDPEESTSAPGISELIKAGAWSSQAQESELLAIIKEKVSNLSPKNAAKLIREFRKPSDGPQHSATKHKNVCLLVALGLLLAFLGTILIVGDKDTKAYITELSKIIMPAVLAYFAGRRAKS